MEACLEFNCTWYLVAHQLDDHNTAQLYFIMHCSILRECKRERKRKEREREREGERRERERERERGGGMVRKWQTVYAKPLLLPDHFRLRERESDREVEVGSKLVTDNWQCLNQYSLTSKVAYNSVQIFFLNQQDLVPKYSLFTVTIINMTVARHTEGGPIYR